MRVIYITYDEVDEENGLKKYFHKINLGVSFEQQPKQNKSSCFVKYFLFDLYGGFRHKFVL